MRTLSLYLVSEILQVFAVALLTLMLIYVTVVAFQLVRDGIRLSFLWPHLLRTLAYPLFFAVPISLLVGITLGIGRMANDHELCALRASGLSHRQLATPVAILSLILAGLDFYLTGWVLPDVHYEQANLRETILRQLQELGSGTNRSILLPGNVSLWVKRYDGPRLTGIVLDIPRGDRARILPELGQAGGDLLRRRLAAHSGKVQLVARECSIEVAEDKSRVLLTLIGVDLHLPEEVNGPWGRDVFDQKFSIDKLPLPLSFNRRGESPKDLSAPELRRWRIGLRDRLRQIEKEIRSSTAEAAESLSREMASVRRRLVRADIETHGRLTFSLACLTFPLVALPLVVLLERRGRLTHFFLGNLVVIVLFFPLIMAGQMAADMGVPAWAAMALPNLVLALAGAGLWRLMVLR